ncbi:SulP family inorganic anion transporter [Pseudobacteriovorax antillogorgiicola]|uniref:Sulfate permease, SulP family n=1 Tax=Pseudobacteriovorax antillogorgiicola TaxID=1513793 RepID=A0A1Y6BUC2_9BACT|nr:SulP family inorganic anion transporter [Pseudobacteriovorax antillogorgiicola]TCS54515.1 SulP family sulfate permease [Pseudobacteriovorax antillogorgiicola]SMF18912.1 sulfate permease, SulP family [Pseudobacteriovorax antillogorgiicola]
MVKSLSISQVKNDVLSGITVALALVPEAVAFSFVAGVEPLVGLYAAFMVGLITAVLGRPGMISGATGAMAVVMVALVASHGAEYLFAAVVLTGVLQIGAGALKLGKFIRIVPHPVMLGFVNGLAIVIFLAQLGQFKVPTADGGTQWMAGQELYVMAGLILLTMSIIHFLPKLTKAVPSSLVAIVTVSFVAIGLSLDSRTVGDVASIAGSLPAFHIPSVPFTMETLEIIFPYSLVLAGVGLIESLLTLSVIDEMTETKGRPNQECLAQGVANLTNGFFGAMGGCAMIGQSMINISSGGRGRLSGITAALSLLAIILFGSSLIEKIPLAALTGVMFMVVIGTFEWSSLRILHRVPKADAFVIILVSAVTVFTDLAVAVIVGVIVSALAFAWKHAKHMTANTELEEGRKTYRLQGSLFFGSTTDFMSIFDVANDPEQVIVDFAHAKVVDHSGLEAIDSLTEKYRKNGKVLHIINLSDDCEKIFLKAGNMVAINKLDPIT